MYAWCGVAVSALKTPSHIELLNPSRKETLWKSHRNLYRSSQKYDDDNICTMELSPKYELRKISFLKS